VAQLFRYSSFRDQAILNLAPPVLSRSALFVLLYDLSGEHFWIQIAKEILKVIPPAAFRILHLGRGEVSFAPPYIYRPQSPNPLDSMHLSSIIVPPHQDSLILSGGILAANKRHPRPLPVVSIRAAVNDPGAGFGLVGADAHVLYIFDISYIWVFIRIPFLAGCL
jgi:hypothetical protein